MNEGTNKNSNYRELSQSIQAKCNALPIRWAFSAEQMARVEKEFAGSEIVRLSCGGFMREEDVHLFDAWSEESNKVLTAYLDTEEGLLDALRFELANHEGDVIDTLNTLGLEMTARVKQALDKIGGWR